MVLVGITHSLPGMFSMSLFVLERLVSRVSATPRQPAEVVRTFGTSQNNIEKGKVRYYSGFSVGHRYIVMYIEHYQNRSWILEVCHMHAGEQFKIGGQSHKRMLDIPEHCSCQNDHRSSRDRQR